MATRIDPNLSEGGHGVFDQRSEHGQFLLSDFSPASYQNQDSFSRINDLCGVTGVNKLNDVRAFASVNAFDAVDDIDDTADMTTIALQLLAILKRLPVSSHFFHIAMRAVFAILISLNGAELVVSTFSPTKRFSLRCRWTRI